MSASPKLKVHNPQGEYVASCKHAEDAAMLVSGYGDGATIRYAGHGKRDIVWTEGAEESSAADSYDAVATTVYDRIEMRRHAGAERVAALQERVRNAA